MSLEYIRNHYKVPAKKGTKIQYQPPGEKIQKGVITGAKNSYLRARMETGKLSGQVVSFHPTWCIKYIEQETKHEPQR